MLLNKYSREPDVHTAVDNTNRPATLAHLKTSEMRGGDTTCIIHPVAGQDREKSQKIGLRARRTLNLLES